LWLHDEGNDNELGMNLVVEGEIPLISIASTKGNVLLLLHVLVLLLLVKGFGSII
jgi:hypothetical protein